MLGQRPMPIGFRRKLEFNGETLIWLNELSLTGDAQIEAMSLGDEFFVRYVPQSRYFQMQELQVSAYSLTADQIRALNNRKKIVLKQTITPQSQNLEVSIS